MAILEPLFLAMYVPYFVMLIAAMQIVQTTILVVFAMRWYVQDMDRRRLTMAVSVPPPLQAWSPASAPPPRAPDFRRRQI